MGSLAIASIKFIGILINIESLVLIIYSSSQPLLKVFLPFIFVWENFCSFSNHETIIYKYLGDLQKLFVMSDFPIFRPEKYSAVSGSNLAQSYTTSYNGYNGYSKVGSNVNNSYGNYQGQSYLQPQKPQSSNVYPQYQSQVYNSSSFSPRSSSPTPSPPQPQPQHHKEERIKSDLIKGDSRIEYVPVEKKVVDYVD